MKYSDFHPFFADKIITDKDSVRNSIKNIVLIERFRLISDFLIGTGVNRVLFSNFSYAKQIYLEKEITTVLDNLEPRIKVIKIHSDLIDNDINIDIFYQIKDSFDDTLDSVNLRLGL